MYVVSAHLETTGELLEVTESKRTAYFKYLSASAEQAALSNKNTLRIPIKKIVKRKKLLALCRFIIIVGKVGLKGKKKIYSKQQVA